ncbi:hypothetical protein [Polaromonas sp.]|uniref:hypothetical protein n=1 Tax=Polaromonas sp. TaxID=1869339 RepID=UPI003BAABE83
MPTAQSPHLVVPFAACTGEAWLQAMKALPAGSLKNLGKLLQGMKLAETSAGEALSLSTPHERVLGNGLTATNPVDGLIPWAALEAAGTHGPNNKAWAFITPCHWAMGREHATLTDPAALGLTADESRTLLAAMQPYFETEGITLHYAAPERWLAEGELFRQLPTASLDRVLGRNVDTWLPGAKTAPSLRRLQNEMQMLLYTHALNDERGIKRQLPVNSFWISGTGALDKPAPAPSHNITVPRNLAQAAFTDDWDAYAQAWLQLDSGDISKLLAQQNAGESVRLSLCGERNAQTFETSAQSFFSRISSLLSPQPPLTVLEQL